MQEVSVAAHYDALVREGNDPVHDPPALQRYMDQWDGPPFIDALALSPKSEVLEIGVGTGRLARKVLQTGCGHFTGIDISPATIQRAAENLCRWNHVSLLTGDFIPFSFSQLFDRIYCSLTLFHFQDKRAFLQKVSALLHPAGRFVLSIPREKETAIHFGTREVPLYPDTLDTLLPLLAKAGLVPCEPVTVAFAHIIVAVKA